MNELTVSWFSAGVSSAVATWLMRDKIDRIIYTHIDDQHPDTLRFVKDCEQWFGKKVEILQSGYRNVENAIRAADGYVNGPEGAPCTKLLKRRVRMEWECDNRWFNYLNYVWGFDSTETDRAKRLCEQMAEDKHVFPLIENGITKAEAHAILLNAGIKRPAMYDLGYRNNNCIGCVKGGKGYWNRIRVDFPEVFSKRAAMERELGHTCLKRERERPDVPASAENSVFLYLDELDPEAGRDEGPVVEACGIMCELLKRNGE
jgi:3'-phosphoadenosine 5'-phosphosulfate sulfotransferase (PAPS reductase)/FAD synthetase